LGLDDGRYTDHILYCFVLVSRILRTESRRWKQYGIFDPLSYILNGKASQWFVYGTLYTIAIVGLGYKFILKYLHNKYQLVRTLSVMFFQLGFAFLIPEILEKLNLRKLILLRI
jgi:hypothetical protein